eukprot:TRINITY_DN4462_c0_g1_i4.p1 TRINITY_DN4462_c0_g1~~TRINITY_DN4462_c0_g1_i4.p1  ORF type:complete len:115 (+),score=2.86 TRINITY_DN4462_c0_g1_i4:274-618(+)
MKTQNLMHAIDLVFVLLSIILFISIIKEKIKMLISMCQQQQLLLLLLFYTKNKNSIIYNSIIVVPSPKDNIQVRNKQQQKKICEKKVFFATRENLRSQKIIRIFYIFLNGIFFF